jgi:hypothetical protein
MAEGSDVSELLRRTVQANARLYKGWVDLSLEYWRGIGEIFGVAPLSGLAGAHETGEQEVEEGAGMLLLEAESGATARGAFLVTNDLGRNVRCELVASDLNGPHGTTLRTKVTFDPASLELAPGEQRVVTATVPVEDRLEPGAAYTGTVSIRGMEGFSVPFVLRRMHSLAEAERAAGRPAADATTATAAGATTAGKSGRGKSAQKKAPKGTRKGKVGGAQPAKRRGK